MWSYLKGSQETPSRRGGPRSRLGEAEDEEEESEETEVEAFLAGVTEAPEAPNRAISNQPIVSQDEKNFFKMMEKMTQFMRQLTQEVSLVEKPRSPELKTLSIKIPNNYDGTQAHKLGRFIQSFQLTLHHDPESFFSDRNKALYSTSFLAGRAGKLIEKYRSNIYHKDHSRLLNHWKVFKTQLFTLFGDPNEARKAEKEVDNIFTQIISLFDLSLHKEFYSYFWNILFIGINGDESVEIPVFANYLLGYNDN
ncbi:hypothetical protein O181_093019 [Austropuccinia psidii MF-1]|uniref:Uncharacterized protein n=1 Tax=Austropuccinia psidii MF-1 TaxID=1389203 RepID=A0A9Q3J0E3_9BASI|nr:hypothetical protein [Austropuccinia psidii MF-1]